MLCRYNYKRGSAKAGHCPSSVCKNLHPDPPRDRESPLICQDDLRYEAGCVNVDCFKFHPVKQKPFHRSLSLQSPSSSDTSNHFRKEILPQKRFHGNQKNNLQNAKKSKTNVQLGEYYQLQYGFKSVQVPGDSYHPKAINVNKNSIVFFSKSCEDHENCSFVEVTHAQKFTTGFIPLSCLGEKVPFKCVICNQEFWNHIDYAKHQLNIGDFCCVSKGFKTPKKEDPIIDPKASIEENKTKLKWEKEQLKREKEDIMRSQEIQSQREEIEALKKENILLKKNKTTVHKLKEELAMMEKEYVDIEKERDTLDAEIVDFINTTCLLLNITKRTSLNDLLPELNKKINEDSQKIKKANQEISNQKVNASKRIEGLERNLNEVNQQAKERLVENSNMSRELKLLKHEKIGFIEKFRQQNLKQNESYVAMEKLKHKVKVLEESQKQINKSKIEKYENVENENDLKKLEIELKKCQAAYNEKLRAIEIENINLKYDVEAIEKERDEFIEQIAKTKSSYQEKELQLSKAQDSLRLMEKERDDLDHQKTKKENALKILNSKLSERNEMISELQKGKKMLQKTVVENQNALQILNQKLADTERRHAKKEDNFDHELQCNEGLLNSLRKENERLEKEKCDLMKIFYGRDFPSP